MIPWIVAAVLAVAFAVHLLALNARTYTRRVEARFPPSGRFIDIDGVRTHIHEAGLEGAPRMLLIHGATSNLMELWGPFAEEFSPLHHVIAYDRPGLGFSARAKRDAHTMRAQAQTAARVLEQTGEGPALVVAHSLGAGVGLRLALDHPRLVSGLVLIAPACNPYPWKPAWWARLSATPIIGDIFCGLIIPWLGPPLSGQSVANNFWPAPVPVNYCEAAGVPLVFRPRAFRANAMDVCASNVEFGAQQPRYAELFTPTVIITAEKDRIVSPKRHARALAVDLPAAELVIAPDTGHARALAVDLPAAELVIAPDTGHAPHRLRTDLVIAAIRRVNEMTSASLED